MKRVKLAALAAISVLGLTACGTTSAPSDYSERPAAWGPADAAGQATCGWIEDPNECSQSGVDPHLWYQMPLVQPVNTHRDDFLASLFMWHVIYSDWYAGDYYRTTYVPVSVRPVYVTHVTTFNTTYHAIEVKNRQYGTYKTSTGKTVTGDKVDTKRFKKAPPRNNGGDHGADCTNANAFVIPGLGQVLEGTGGTKKRTTTKKVAPAATKKPAPATTKKPAPAATTKKAPTPTGTAGNRGQGGDSQHDC